MTSSLWRTQLPVSTATAAAATAATAATTAATSRHQQLPCLPTSSYFPGSPTHPTPGYGSHFPGIKPILPLRRCHIFVIFLRKINEVK